MAAGIQELQEQKKGKHKNQQNQSYAKTSPIKMSHLALDNVGFLPVVYDVFKI